MSLPVTISAAFTSRAAAAARSTMRPKAAALRLTLTFAFLPLILALGTFSAAAKNRQACREPSVFAQKWDQVRQSTAYIFFDVTDPATGEKTRVHGTGFVVSRLGHVLTASHLLRDWSKQTPAEKKSNPLKASLGGKPGYVSAKPLTLSAVNAGGPDAGDAALLKLPDPDRNAVQGYAPAPLCLGPGGESAKGDSFLAFGFPRGKSIQPVPGIFKKQSVDGGRWAATGAFADGMSGGPVYGTTGNLIGMVKGGPADSEAGQWITPIRHMGKLLRQAGASQECSGVGFVQALNITVMNKSLRPKPSFKTLVVNSIIERVHLRVIDGASGAAIPNASVKVTKPKSNVSFAGGNTDEHGEFSFKLLYERFRVKVKDGVHQDLAVSLHLTKPDGLRVLLPMNGRRAAKRVRLRAARR